VTGRPVGGTREETAADAGTAGRWETGAPEGWRPATSEELHEVERFLYDEAAMLDAWALERWLELVEDDIEYVVPATDVRHGDPDRTLTFVHDDIVRLRARVTRLTSRRAFREYPWSRTRRILTNVRVDAEPGGRCYAVSANLTLHWFRNRRTAVYVGRLDQVLRRTDGGLRIARRTAVLDLEALDPHGAVSVIL
jgi:p-cumate 2,3-dioxygenase beta subunit